MSDIPSTVPPIDATRRVLPFVILTVFLDLVGFGIILPVLPLYVKTMGGSPGTVGILFSSFAFIQLVATPILGRASDRYGRRVVIVTSLAGNVLSMLIFALAAHQHQLVLLFASRLIAGATAGNLGACQATIADVFHGADRVRGMGRIGAGVALGVMLGPVIGGWASLIGSEAPPLVAAALAFVALVGVIVFLPETNRNIGVVKAKMPRRPPMTALLENPKLAMILGLYFLTFLYMSNLQISLPLLADARLHWSGTQLGNVFGLFGLVMLLVQGFGVGALSRRVAAPTIVTVGGLASALGLGIIASAHTPAVLLGGCVVLALGLGCTQPLLASLASDYAGEAQQGTVLGFAQSSGGLARAVGPLLWGSLYGLFGPSASFLGGAIAALAACGIGFALRASSATPAALVP